MPLRTPHRLLKLLGTAALLATALLVALDAYREYRRELNVLEARLLRETELLAEHARLSFGATSMVLDQVERRIGAEGVDGLAGNKTYWRQVREMLASAPQLAQLAVIDETGRVRFTSSHFPTRDITVANRQYFQAHAAGAAFQIGAPVIAYDTGNEVIPVSRRIEGPEGEFGGVLVATLNVDYFHDLYSRVRDEIDVRIGMYLHDGTVLTLQPIPPGGAPGSAPTDSVADLGGDAARSFVGASPLDGSKKIIALRAVSPYPVIVSVARDYQAFLVGMAPTFARHLIGFLLIAAGILFGALLLRRSIRQADEARDIQLELARRQREAERFSHAITSHFPNGRVAIFDRDHRYVFADGEAFREDSSLAPDRIIGKSISEVYPAPAAEMLNQLASRALAGEEVSGDLAHRDNVYKVTAIPLENDEGDIEQGLFLAQDITELKAAQQALEARNRELEALSATDSLLGIANRRAFDERLKLEWQRLARDEKPLALLMVDVDQFKRYNDTYGHPAGDVALQRIAAALRDAAVRSSDLVARYGGEEMAVLLPDTNFEGALRVASRIHASIAEEAIPFPESPVAPFLTVSIGATALIPSERQTPEALVGRADEALYAAKKTGRNRTATSVDEI